MIKKKKLSKKRRNPDHIGYPLKNVGKPVNIRPVTFISLNDILPNIQQLSSKDIKFINDSAICFCGTKNPSIALFSKEKFNQFLISIGLSLEKIWIILLAISQITRNEPVYIGVFPTQ